MYSQLVQNLRAKHSIQVFAGSTPDTAKSKTGEIGKTYEASLHVLNVSISLDSRRSGRLKHWSIGLLQ